MGRRIVVYWFLPALLASLLAAWVFREPLLVSAGQFLIRSDAPDKADLIYVLAGDFWGSRVLAGSELGARGYAKQVVFSGGLYADDYEGDMSIRFAVEHGYPRPLFLAVPLQARSTIEEAVELRPIFERLRAKRVILVTSDYH
ncbi:MAG TPA: YdcF family protein, partial [Bryobacteraceae bacterium]|nr:YdcF family protein [Bryobacteraceae bacterium]